MCVDFCDEVFGWRKPPRNFFCELPFVGKLGGKTFFLASVKKINSVCNVPSESNEKDYNLESDESLLSL